MQPSKIKSVLNIARNARKLDRNWNPMFVGAPGVGKSEIVQQWCKENNLPFIDLRLAYLESCDLLGFPSIEKRDGRQITVHNTPEFWPSEGEGVLLLDEPNRGVHSVMNACMQLLTDRKVHKYEIPKGWIIVGCINPEDDPTNDVNTMDTPLKDRFEFFYVNYDKQTFLDYMKEQNYDENIIMFVETGTWTYTLPGDIKLPGTKYISPRTFSKLDTAIKAGVPSEMELTVYESILGQVIGQNFYKFKYDETPIRYQDLLKNKKAALKKLKKWSDPSDYKSGYIGITIKDIVEHGGDIKEGITDDLLIEVILAMPADQGVALLRELEYKRQDSSMLQRILSKNPEVEKYFKEVLSYKKAK